MRRKEIGERLMPDNETYRKARPNDEGEKAPRESPSRQSPGKQGYGRPEYDRWTHEELLELAHTLEIPDADQLSRDDLVERLVSREIR